MTARLHVMLGAGGVGKTTLAAGYALALASAPGRRVGLLGIDPSRRLKDALGIPLGDADAPVPTVRALRAAVLKPAESVRRWAVESCPDPRMRDRLFENPFFVAMADRLATATDIFAAARVAEWAERDPELTDLVVDTAPGLNAIEFLTRPERLAAFLGGRLVGWLRGLAPERASGSSAEGLGGGARRIVWGLVRVGGSRLMHDLADFFSLVETMFARMLERVKATQRWLRDETTEILVVTSVSDDGAQMARGLIDALSAARLAPCAVIVNRAAPVGLAGQRGALELAAASDLGAAPVVRYALAYAAIQARVVEAAEGLAPKIVIVPDARGLDGDGRLESLTQIGQTLRAALE
ncbi:MAG: ArsA-related P-loop ATPase [Polyangiaceae bacterium]